MLSNYIKEENEKRRREANEKIMSETEDKIVVPIDKPEISKKVKVDLEVDTSVKDLGTNPYVKIIHMARVELTLEEYFQDCF